MYAPIPANRNSIHTGMGAAVVSPNTARCKAGLSYDCDPNRTWWDLIVNSNPSGHSMGYYSTACREQRDVYEGCMSGEYPGVTPAPPAGHALIPKPVGSAPASDYEQQSAATQDQRDDATLDQWKQNIRDIQPDPPTDDSGIPWLWIGLGAAAIIALRRL